MISKTIANAKIATVTASLTLAASALAAAPAGAATVYVCAKAKGGTVRIVGRSASCHRGEHKLSLGTGPAGPQGLQGKEGSQGKEGAAGHNGADGAVAGYFASHEAPVLFTAAAEVSIVSKTIPAGNYIVFGKTAVFSGAEGGVFAGAQCELRDGANTLDTAVWMQLLPFLGGTFYGGSTTLPLQAALSTTAPSTLSILCSDRSPDLANQYVDAAYAQLEAIQTSRNS
jgi:hypothetical protein